MEVRDEDGNDMLPAEDVADGEPKSCLIEQSDPDGDCPDGGMI